MIDSFRFYLRKKYDQFRYRIITSNSINLKISDYTLAENEKIYMAIREKGDVDEDEIYVELRAKEDNEFIADLPCNKLTTYEFRIFTRLDDKIVEQSAINNFKYEGFVFDERKIEDTTEWGMIQDILHRFLMAEENLHDTIIENVENSEFGDTLNEFMEKNQEQVNEIQRDVNTVISQLSKILDDFIDEGDI